MAGHVKVESTVGEGTKFIITFKTSCRVSNTNEKILVINKESNYPHNFKQSIDMANQLFIKNGKKKKVSNDDKPWILVANDDHFMLQMVEGLLEDDFNVDMAENGLQAFRLVKKHPKTHYKAILLDINMPIMDGIEACQKIHSFLKENDLISNMRVK